VTTRKTARSWPRVFLGLRETAGYYRGLRDGFRELGVQVTHVDLSADPHGYNNPASRLHRACRWVARKRLAARQPMRAAWAVAQGCLATLVLCSAIPRHDAFIFGTPHRFMASLVYPLLRLLGKRVISVYHGTTVRPPYLNAKYVGGDGPISVRILKRETDRAVSGLRAAERWSHYVVNHPPTAQFAAQGFVDFLTLGIPYRFPAGTQFVHARAEVVRVLHAPSDRVAKGSALIRSAVEEARAEVSTIEYVEISGRQHSEVVEEMHRAHLVVDQAYSDQPMPGFAAEAAAHGLPVIIGSEDWVGATYGIPPSAVPPTIQVHPSEIAKTIADLASNSERRKRSGAAGEKFVRDRWSPAAVASRFMKLVSDEVPKDWLRFPSDVQYVHGIGLPERRVGEAVAALVSAFGAGSLRLDEKVELRDRLLALARAYPQPGDHGTEVE